jgi:hypothetical protein
MDKLIGMKNTTITYFFENLEIGIPDVQGPKGQQIGSGKFTINGGIRISTELNSNNKSNEYNIVEEKSSLGNGSSSKLVGR